MRQEDITIGSNIKKLRRLKGMTQTQLADALGLTFQQVQKYEKGSNRVACSRALDIMNALDCSLLAIFAGVYAVTAQPTEPRKPIWYESKQAFDHCQAMARMGEEERDCVLKLVRTLGPVL